MQEMRIFCFSVKLGSGSLGSPSSRAPSATRADVPTPVTHSPLVLDWLPPKADHDTRIGKQVLCLGGEPRTRVPWVGTRARVGMKADEVPVVDSERLIGLEVTVSVSAERASVSLLSGEEVGYLSSPGCRLLEHQEIRQPEEVPRQREADPSRGKGGVH